MINHFTTIVIHISVTHKQQVTNDRCQTDIYVIYAAQQSLFFLLSSDLSQLCYYKKIGAVALPVSFTYGCLYNP